MKTEGLPVTTVVERVNRISFASPLVVKLVDNFRARVNLGIKKKGKERKRKEEKWAKFGSMDRSNDFATNRSYDEYTRTG